MSADDKEKTKENSMAREEDSDQKFKRKQKKKPFGCLWSLLLWLVFIALGITAISIYLALNHKFFDINKISIVGNHRISEEEILKTIDFSIGDNIFKIRSSENEEKLLQIKGIESAIIKKIVPNKVQIEIFEIFDIGYIREGRKIYIIDKDGYVKEGSNNTLDQEDLIEFTSINTNNISIGMNIGEDDYFKELVNAIKTKPFYRNIEKIDLGNFYEFIMYFRDGLLVTFQSEDIEKSMEDLEVILNTIADEGIRAKEIIMNIGDHPVIIQENRPGENDN